MEDILEIALLFAVISLCVGYIALFIANDVEKQVNKKSQKKSSKVIIEDYESNKYVTIDVLQEDFMAVDRKSRIVIELFTSIAPKTVENFYQLCKEMFY